MIIKKILDNTFKLENDILYKFNKKNNEWRDLSIIKRDKYNHQLVSIWTDNKSRVLRLENLMKCFNDDNYDITNIFRVK